MHDVTLVHPGGGGVVSWGKELMQSAIRYNNLDPRFRIRTVVTFAGRAEINGARSLNSSKFSKANTREVSVIDGGLLLGLLLRV